MRFLFSGYSHKKTDEPEINTENLHDNEFEIISPKNETENIPTNTTEESNNTNQISIPINHPPIKPLEIVIDHSKDEEINEETPLLPFPDVSPKLHYNTISSLNSIHLRNMIYSPISSSMMKCKSRCNENDNNHLADFCKENLITETFEMKTYEVLSPCKSQPINISFFYDTLFGIKWRVNGVRIYNYWFSRSFFIQKNFRIECINLKLNDDNPTAENKMSFSNEMRIKGELPITPHNGLILHSTQNQQLKWEPFDLYLFYYVLRKI